MTKKNTMDQSRTDRIDIAGDRVFIEIKGPKEKIREYWSRQNWRKWLELFCCIVFTLLCAFIPQLFEVNDNFSIPYQVLNDGSVLLGFTNDHELVENETLPTTENYLISGVGVLLFVSAASFFKGKHAGETHAAICGFLVSFALSSVTTSSLKLYVGRLRPNFFDKCEFETTTLECLSESGEEQARKSFPSGHSSLVFVGMTYLTIFLLGKAGSYHRNYWFPASSSQSQDINNEKLHPYTIHLIRRLLSIIAILPMIFAYYVAASRIVDKM